MHINVRRAFYSGSSDATVVARLYCEFVALELLLKDELQSRGVSTSSYSHDVDTMAKRLVGVWPSNIGSARSVVNAKLQVLRRCLSGLVCTGLNGQAINVPAGKYPYIRYLRHETDFPTTLSSPEQDVVAARDALGTVFSELRLALGVSP